MLEAFARICAAWSDTMLRVLAEGGLVLGGAWVLSLALQRVPAAGRSWLWRLAYVRLLLALVCLPPLVLPILPPPPADLPAPHLDVSLSQAAPAQRPGSPPTQAAAASAPTGIPAAEPEIAAPARTPVSAWLFLAWAAGAGWCALRLGGDWRRSRRLARSGSPASSDVTRIWTQLCRENGVASPPPVRELADLPGPLLLPGLPPVVLVPSGLAGEWSETEIRLMLAHELAHLRRRDLWWSWLAAAAHCLFYFHPLLWLANREWRLAQEIACDELALTMTSSPAAPYGALLVKLALRPASGRKLGLAAVDGDSPRTLERRLIAMRTLNSAGKRRFLFTAALAGIAGAAILLPIRVTAQTAAKPVPTEPVVTLRAVEAPKGGPAAPARRETVRPAQADAERGADSFEQRQERLRAAREELERRIEARQKEQGAVQEPAAERIRRRVAERLAEAEARLRAAEGRRDGERGPLRPAAPEGILNEAEIRELAEGARRQALEHAEQAREHARRAREQAERTLREQRSRHPGFRPEEVEKALREAEVHSSRALEQARREAERALAEVQRSLPRQLEGLGPEQRKQLHEEIERELKRVPAEIERAMAEAGRRLHRERSARPEQPRPEAPRPEAPRPELRAPSRAELEARIRELEEQIRTLRRELEKQQAPR